MSPVPLITSVHRVPLGPTAVNPVKPALAQLSGEQVALWVQGQTHLRQVRDYGSQPPSQSPERQNSPSVRRGCAEKHVPFGLGREAAVSPGGHCLPLG